MATHSRRSRSMTWQSEYDADAGGPCGMRCSPKAWTHASISSMPWTSNSASLSDPARSSSAQREPCG